MYSSLGFIRHQSEKKIPKQIVYFGTKGKHSGHQAIGINRNLSTEERTKWNEVDNNYWIEQIMQKPGWRIVKFYDIIYTVYSVPFSVDDNRPYSHTNVFWEDVHSEEEMIELIKSDIFLKQQFNM